MLDYSNLPTTSANDSTIQSVINIFMVIAGAIAVLTIVIAGVQFVASRGDSAKVSKARSAILYAVIGLVVLILAFTIVNFVIFRVAPN